MIRIALLLPLLLLAGCGDTWDRFTTPDFSWSRDRAVSADRMPAGSEAAGASGSGRQAAAADGCYRGRLTPEGDTCQAMRTDGGDLLTLAGPLRGFADGDSVCVCGVPAARQFCDQGVTMLVREISDTCADIR